MEIQLGSNHDPGTINGATIKHRPIQKYELKNLLVKYKCQSFAISYEAILGI